MKKTEIHSIDSGVLARAQGCLLGQLAGDALGSLVEFRREEEIQNALWQLLHASNLEEAVVDTVMRGGDTDTNAAICGALLGAVHGREAIPDRWTECLRNCRPLAGQAHVFRPRPRRFWPVDAMELAERLIR